MENFETILDEEVELNQQKRPVFLTVLCILTFVGSGFGILSALMAFTGFSDIESTLNRSDPFNQVVINNVDITAMQSLQNWVNILSLLSCILCLSGALVMWRLKKFGFILYVAGHAATLFATYMSLGLMKMMGEIMPMAEMGGMMQTMGAAVFVVTLIISIGFIIMYGVNLKAMNK